MEGCFVVLALGIAATAIGVAISASSRGKANAQQLADLQQAIRELQSDLRGLRDRERRNDVVAEAAAAPSERSTAPPVEPAAATAAPVLEEHGAYTAPDAVSAALPEAGSADALDSAAAGDVPQAEPPLQPPPLPQPPSPYNAEAAAASAFTAEPHAVEPPAEAPPSPPPASSPSPPPPRAPFDWESLIGVKLFSWIAAIAAVLGVVFFLKYSVEHGWISPTVRAAMGFATGIGLIILCERKVARNYAVTANALHGAGVAILYATLFACHALWHLLPSSVVFALKIVVTALAVTLSIRRDSVFIALLGLLGGFATPALISTGENNPIGLFSYLLLLNAGLAWIAFQKRWPALTIASLIFTVLYQWAWVGKFLTASQLPIAAGIFAMFAVAGASLLWLRARDDGEEPSPWFARVGVASALLPLLFALFAAAVPAYGARFNILFAFLLLLVTGLAFVAHWRAWPWLLAGGAIATILTFAVWCAVSYENADSWPTILIWIALFVVLLLTAGALSQSRAVHVAGLLFFMFPLLAQIEPRASEPWPLFGTMFLLLAAVACVAVVTGRAAVYFFAAGFSILAQGIWSAHHLDRTRLISALVIYGAFALLFLAVPFIARLRGQPLTPSGGVAATTILSLTTLLFFTFDRVAESSLWGLAILLSALLLGTMAEARAAGRAGRVTLAVVVGWIVLGCWWEGAPLASALGPALAVATLVGLIVLGGVVWMSRAGSADGSSGTGGANAFLALGGHLFLLFVASDESLSVPPWPMFTALTVLLIANAVASRLLRTPMLLAAAAIASQLVLAVWTFPITSDRWPDVALVAALVVAAFTIGCFVLNRGGELEAGYADAAVAAIVAGHFVAFCDGINFRQLHETLLLTHLVLIVATMAIAFRRESYRIVAVSSLIAAVAALASRPESRFEEIGFAAALYAPFVIYPLVLGRRVQRSLAPHLAAVIASAFLFFIGRNALMRTEYREVIGLLPVAEAVVLGALILGLLRVERGEERHLSRLALVAGAALAFVTVAIPLQLEKQWITVGWALEAAALVWLFRRVPHRGLLLWSAALFGAVFVRLVFNRAVFDYHRGDGPPIFNWFLYTYGICASAMFAAAWLLPEGERLFRRAASAAGTIVLFFLLNIEIADFYAIGPRLTFNFRSSSLAQDLTYTIGWAIFALAMLLAGLVLRSKPSRIAAILLLLVTVLKCFLHDLSRLGGLYRVGSLLGLAISLVLVGVLLQKFVLAKPAPDSPSSA